MTFSHQVVTNANSAFKDKVHLCNLIFLIENQRVFFDVRIEFGGSQAKADVIEEALITLLLSLEEGPEAINDVIEKIVQHYVVLDY